MFVNSEFSFELWVREYLVRKIWPVVAVLAVPVVVALSFAAWLIFAVWAYEHRPAAVFAHNFTRIEQGMKLEQVNSLLAMDGIEIKASEVPIIDDPKEPNDSPRRLRPAVSGERYYEWRTKDDSYILVSLQGGVVNEKFLSVCHF